MFLRLRFTSTRRFLFPFAVAVSVAASIGTAFAAEARVPVRGEELWVALDLPQFRADAGPLAEGRLLAGVIDPQETRVALTSRAIADGETAADGQIAYWKERGAIPELAVIVPRGAIPHDEEYVTTGGAAPGGATNTRVVYRAYMKAFKRCFVLEASSALVERNPALSSEAFLALAATLRVGGTAVTAHDLVEQAARRGESGDRDGASADLDRAIALDPTSAEAFTQRGLLKQGRRDSPGAIEDFTEALKRDPKDAQTYGRRARLREKAGDAAGADADWTAAIEAAPTRADLRYSRGVHRQKQKDLDAALLDYDEALRLDPAHAWAHNNRASVRQARGDFDGAITDCTDAIHLQAGFPAAYHNRALARRAKGDLDGAIEDESAAIEQMPSYPQAFRGRGAARLAKKDAEGSAADFRAAMHLEPGYASDAQGLGAALEAKGDAGGALTAYSEALRLAPGLPALLFGQAKAREESDDLDGALNDFDEGLRHSPKDGSGLYGRGNLHVLRGEWAEAAADLRAAATLLQGTWTDYAMLAAWHARSRGGQRVEATAALREYLAHRPAPGGEDWFLALASFVTGKSDEAALWKEAATGTANRAREKSTEAWFYAGVVALLDGSVDRAAVTWRKCVETGVKGFSEPRWARAELQRIAKPR